MRTLKIVAAAAILSTTAATANAGGLAPVIPEAPVVIVDEPAPTGSINSGFIVLGVLAALVAASASF